VISDFLLSGVGYCGYRVFLPWVESMGKFLILLKSVELILRVALLTPGDEVRVLVNNFMSNWSTAIHWHGIDQRSTTWMDGVAGVSQCGIPPGRNFTYEFRLNSQRGTFWWHAHLSIQYSDGLYGPIVSQMRTCEVLFG
jgi:hypothetical protein